MIPTEDTIYQELHREVSNINNDAFDNKINLNLYKINMEEYNNDLDIITGK